MVSLQQLTDEFKESWGLYPDSRQNTHFNNELRELLEQVCERQLLSMQCSVNINFHPDYTGDPDWRVYPTVRKAINDLHIDLDTFNQYLEWDDGARILGFNSVVESIDI